MAMSPTVRRRRLAAVLKRMREDAGITWADCNDRLGFSHSKMSRLEGALSGISMNDTMALARLYGADEDTVRRLGELARDMRKRGWWHTYRDTFEGQLGDLVETEAEASRVSQFVIDLMPGLTQTRDYAKAIISAAQEWSDEELYRRLELREKRQERLLNGELELWAIMDEAALNRVVGGPQVHLAQLKHLADLEKNLPNFTLQVLPFENGEHSGMGATFWVFDFPDFDPIAYVDTLVGGMCSEEPADVQRYRRAFEFLQAAAWDRKPSMSIVRRYIKKLS